MGQKHEKVSYGRYITEENYKKVTYRRYFTEETTKKVTNSQKTRTRLGRLRAWSGSKLPKATFRSGPLWTSASDCSNVCGFVGIEKGAKREPKESERDANKKEPRSNQNAFKNPQTLGRACKSA